MQNDLAQRYGVATLKIRHHAQLGYVIEVPAASVEKLRAHPELALRQGMANGARFTLPELSDLDRRIAEAETRAGAREAAILRALVEETLAAQEANGPASVLRRIESDEMDRAAARLAAQFGLSGLHGLDYVRDDQGQAHLIEINPRGPQTSYLSFGAGHDLVSALASRVDGHARPPRPCVANDVVALFPQEWMRDPASPYLTTAFHDVPWDDPALIRAWMESQQAHPALEKWRAFMATTPQGAGLAAQS
jgi:hypothetical protein